MTRFGIDALLAEPERYLVGRKVALLANQASLTSDGRPTLEALRQSPHLELTALLTPEHGWSGYEDDATPIGDRRDARTGLAQHSLYGPRRRPSAEVLAGVDAVIVDVTDVGLRCYTYAATTVLLCEAAAQTGTRVVLCDRPSLLGPRVDGPALDPARRSFLGYLDVPFQHGRTLGEVVAWATRNLAVDLVVADFSEEAANSAEASSGETSSAASGSTSSACPPFVPPSPGLPTPEAVALYPGLVLLEGTNLNEGRGTTLPFQLLGAPWLDGYRLAAQLNNLGLPGLLFRPLTYLPRSDTHAGQLCSGVQLLVTDRSLLRPLEAVVRILRHVRQEFPAEFAWVEAASRPWADLPGAGEPWHEPVTGYLVDALVGDDSVREVVEGSLSLSAAQAAWAETAVAWARDYRRFAARRPHRE